MAINAKTVARIFAGWAETGLLADAHIEPQAKWSNGGYLQQIRIKDGRTINVHAIIVDLARSRLDTDADIAAVSEAARDLLFDV